MTKISIIIPCYNAQDYICKCLNGLLQQTYKDFSVVIVDDCSKDNTIKVVEEWVENHSLRVNIISNQKNLGPSLSRYNGAKHCESDWVAFCDSDDWYEPTFLNRMLTKAESSQCEIVFCGYRNIINDKEDNHPLGNKEQTLTSKDAMFLNVSSLCMTLVKREIYINTPQPDIRNGEDMAVIPLLIQRTSKVGALNDILYNYYIRHGSASLIPSNHMIESLIHSFEFINRNIDDNYYSEKEYLGIRNLIYGCLLNLFKFSYDTKKASKIINNFEKDFPKWYKNENIGDLPLFKRIFIQCVRFRLYGALFILSHIHTFMLK